MTHQEYRERLDEILTRLENQVAIDVTRRVLAHKSGQSPKGSHLEAKQAIDRLFLDMVGKDAYHVDEVFGHRFESNREMIGANQLRQQLRTTITGKEGGDE